MKRIPRAARLAITWLYWLALMTMPFWPSYLNNRVLDRLDCGYSTQCFSYALPFISEQGIFVGAAIAIIWPVALYKLYLSVMTYRREAHQLRS